MANTLVQSGRFIQVTLDGATALTIADFATLLGNAQINQMGILVRNIRFTPSAADDVMVIRDRSATGAELFRWKAASVYDQIAEAYGDPGTLMFPYVKAADLTLGTAANAKLVFEIA